MAGSKGNKNAVGNNGGRPPFFTNEKDLQEKIDEFFTEKLLLKQPATISELAYSLGFMSRQSIYDYAEKIEFSYTIKRAILRIEAEYEKGLRLDRSPTGSIFALKNFGWVDSQKVDHSSQDGTMTPNITVVKENTIEQLNKLGNVQNE